MKEMVKALVESRKVFLTLVSVLVGVVFVLTGKLSVAEFTPYVGGLTAVLVFSIAHEDRGRKGKEVSVTVPVSIAPPPMPTAVPSLPPSAVVPIDSLAPLAVDPASSILPLHDVHAPPPLPRGAGPRRQF